MLRYETNQHYDSHYDSFAEEEYGPQFSQRVSGGVRAPVGGGRRWAAASGVALGWQVECV